MARRIEQRMRRLVVAAVGRNRRSRPSGGHGGDASLDWRFADGALHPAPSKPQPPPQRRPVLLEK